ncbi:hypothetical protein [Salinibacter ruber]|uniref:hypothetical protein n=1 Tax=Salinibacter ruber TaxID=146919 RepID=UPI00216A141A|nr:hypothetical protein [Salinibacter ruber]MCS3639880.1 hypothetical protein [Salinibacter ruber]
MTIGFIFALAGTVMVFVLTAQVATYSQPQGSRRRDEGILREVIGGFVVGASMPAIVILSVFLLFGELS